MNGETNAGVESAVNARAGTPTPFSRALIEAGILFVVAAVALLSLAQPDFYKTDGPYLVQKLVDGDQSHPYNIGYLPVLHGWYGLVEKALGASEYEAASWLSAFGVALGIALAHLGLRRAVGGVQSVAASLAFVLTPGVLFFGTVVEMHAVFLPLSMLAFWLAVEVRWSASRWVALTLGVLAGAVGHAGFMVHGTGLLLPGLLVPSVVLGLLWNETGGKLRSALFTVGLSVVHLGAWGVLPRRYPVTYGRTADQDGGLELLMQGTGQSFGFLDLPSMVWHEFLWPFLPFLVFAVWPRTTPGLARAGLRVGLAVGALPYLVLCGLLLTGEPEFGAYTLPFAWPLALAAGTLLVREGAVAGKPILDRGLVLGFALACVVAVAVFVERSGRQGRRGAEFAGPWAEGVEAAVSARAQKPEQLWFLVIDNDEASAALSRRSHDLIINLFVLTGIQPGVLAALMPQVQSRVKTAHSERAVVVLTDATIRELGPDRAKVFLDDLRAHFQVERFEHGAFGGYWIDR